MSDTPDTKEQAIDMAKRLVRYSVERQNPCAFEVVSIKRKGTTVYETQPFGMHALFKSHTLVHVEPIPKDIQSAVGRGLAERQHYVRTMGGKT